MSTALLPSQVYSKLYSTATERGLYGGHNRRAAPIVRYLLSVLSPPADILEASCGRGFVVRWLIGLGFNVLGTEIADWLFEPGGDLYSLPVKKLAYEDFGILGAKQFDAIISSDVLEHLESERAVRNALMQFIRITRKHLLISIGLGAGRSPVPGLVERNDLHLFQRPIEWWRELFSGVMDISEEIVQPRNYYAFGVI